MKSEKNIVRDILKAQGVYEHGDTPEPTEEAIKVLRDYGQAKWSEAYDDGYHEATEGHYNYASESGY